MMHGSHNVKPLYRFMYVIRCYLNRPVCSFTSTYTLQLTNCMQQDLCWKDKISHLGHKFPVFYEIRMFITVFTTVRHLPLPRANFFPFHARPISCSSMLILYNEVLHDLYPTQNIIRMIKSKVTRVVHMARKG
jgi:hypothetical protein